jgi:CheY-like chemotaxis protein
MLARMLRDDGYDVETLADGAVAIGRLTRDPLPDALVTGLRMPHVDGLAVARYALSRHPPMRVVFLTSHPEQVDSGMRARTVVHSKPVDYAALRRQIDESERAGAAG